MGNITDYTLPNVRWSLEENRRLLASHRGACRPCRTRKPSKTTWCPYGWQLAGAQRQLQVMIRRMEAIQLEDRQPSLFDDPGEERAAAALKTPTTALDRQSDSTGRRPMDTVTNSPASAGGTR